MQNQWCIDIRHVPRSGDFDMSSSNPLCFSTQPGRGVVGMSWIGALLISSCITIAFMYFCKGTMSIVLKSCLGTWSASSVLAEKIEPAF